MIKNENREHFLNVNEPLALFDNIALFFSFKMAYCFFIYFLKLSSLNSLAGETSMLWVKAASSSVSKDARATVSTNDCWQCVCKIGCSSIIQDGYNENWQGVWYAH